MRWHVAERCELPNDFQIKEQTDAFDLPNALIGMVHVLYIYVHICI